MYRIDPEIQLWAYQAERAYDNYREPESVEIIIEMNGESDREHFDYDRERDWDDFILEALTDFLRYSFDCEDVSLWNYGKTVDARDTWTNEALTGSVTVIKNPHDTTIKVVF